MVDKNRKYKCIRNYHSVIIVGWQVGLGLQLPPPVDPPLVPGKAIVITLLTVTLVWCYIIVGSNSRHSIVFNFNLAENPALNCALFANEFVVK